MDMRVGGTRLVGMEVQTPDGPARMWFTGEYREIVERRRLVYTESMSDEDGNVLSPADVGMPEGIRRRRSPSSSIRSTVSPGW
jgi:uncharacterized protein YndB with AHSA1/START domain